MKLNRDYLLYLMKKNNWSRSELANAMGVSPATVSRVLNNNREAGKNFIAGLLKAFPNEKISNLFFLDLV